MLQDFFNWILKIFGKKTQTTEKEIQRNNIFANDYGDITGVNIEAIICNKIAGIVEYESDVNVKGDNARAEELNKITSKFYKNKFRKLIADTLGNGGMFVVPTFIEGKIIEDVIPQNRVLINKCINGELFDITCVAEK